MGVAHIDRADPVDDVAHAQQVLDALSFDLAERQTQQAVLRVNVPNRRNPHQHDQASARPTPPPVSALERRAMRLNSASR